jgi:small subunit ribosomal protein S13
MDPLHWLWIEADLKREMWENLVHQQMIGSYISKRHAMGLPVHRQNTQTNARTVRKLNRVEWHR